MHRIPLPRRLLLALFGAVLVCAAAAATASAADTAPAASLTGAEHGAATIRSVGATDDPSLGLVLTITFAGDVQNLFGQGGLAHGGIAVSIPATAPYVDAGGVLLASGGTATVELKAGKTAQTAFLPAAQKLITVGTASAGAVAFRDRSTVVLWLPAMRAPVPTRLSVKAFASGVTPTQAGFTRLAGAHAGSAHTVRVAEAKLTAGELAKLHTQLSTHQANLQQLLSRSRSDVRRVTAESRRQSSRPLRSALSAAAGAIRQLTVLLRQLRAFRTQVQTLATATAAPAVSVVQTDTLKGQSLATEPSLALTTLPAAGLPLVTIDDDQRGQQFAGLGAAITDSAAYLIHNGLSPTSSQALIEALFGAPGTPNSLNLPAIHLNFARIAIGSSGAMTVTDPYSLDDMPLGLSDPHLNHFSIAHDTAYLIPVLQQALEDNPSLSILANPWSPPAWMKANGQLGNPDGTGALLAKDFDAFAQYFVKFIQAYQAAGVPISAITPENEPSSGTTGTVYPGMTFTEPDEASFIANNLAPALSAAGLNPQIYGSDLAWDQAGYADALAASPAVGDLAGIAWHCYFGSPYVMSQLAAAAPQLRQIVDECSPEIRPVGAPEEIISSLRNDASVYSIWTVALDPTGGPILPGNACHGCTGPVTIDPSTGSVTVKPEYYQLGQVSDFVQPGAVRVASDSQVTYGYGATGYETATSGLDDVAFVNPDGSHVLVADDNSNKSITFTVDEDGRYFTATLPPRAMTTFTWR